MTPFPDLRVLLPSQAKEALTQYFFERFKSSIDPFYARPTYEIHHAWKDMERAGYDFSGHWFSIREECFQAALRRLDQLHPLTYEDTPEGRRYIRKGLNPKRPV